MPEFFESFTANLILSILTHCHTWSSMGLIAGGPGIGKTITVEQYRTRFPSVWVLVAHPNASTSYQMLRSLAVVLGIARKSGQASAELWEAIRDRVRDQEGLLVIDEAQHLKRDALESLRALHDAAGVGIVLVGDRELFPSVMSRAQLSSRISMRRQFGGPEDADVESLATAYGISDRKTIDLLGRVARTPGALRVTRQALDLARSVTAGAVTHKDVRAAVDLLGVEVAS